MHCGSDEQEQAQEQKQGGEQAQEPGQDVVTELTCRLLGGHLFGRWTWEKHGLYDAVCKRCGSIYRVTGRIPHGQATGTGWPEPEA